LNILYNAIYSYDGKAEFSASLCQASVSHDPFLLFSMLKTLDIFLETVMLFKDYLVETAIKNSILK